MSPDALKTVPLELDVHPRAAFSCGVESLDRYLHSGVERDLKQRYAAAFVLLEQGEREEILGYYTLAASSLRLAALSETRQKKLPRYPVIPCTLLGRLAVAQSMQGKGVGGVLLVDALKRALYASAQVASHFVLVDALDERAAEFYRAHDFQPLPEQPLRLFLPPKTVEEL